MSQENLPFKFEMEKKEKDLTGLTGLLLHLAFFKNLNLNSIIRKHLRIRDGIRGYRDDQIILALILLNLAGGESVSDIEILMKDEGFCRIMEAMELRGKTGRSRKKIKARWSGKAKPNLPSSTSIFRYLEKFHNEAEESSRQEGKAFIPATNKNLEGLKYINQELMGLMQVKVPSTTATLDMDATLVHCDKSTALWCYKGGKAYQPLNVWWSEQEKLLHSEFRDGNVPAGHEQLRVFKESLELLPLGVERVFLRSDSAGYQHDLMKYCDSGNDERFGRIYFAIGADVTEAFKKAIISDKDLEWKELCLGGDSKRSHKGKEWVEVCYVPNAICGSKRGLEYRYIVIREGMNRELSPEMSEYMNLPFPTMVMDQKRYKLTAIVTNLEWKGEEVIEWYYKRAGKSEQAHSILKEDFAGGRLPSGYFGVNAAWWWIALLAMNIHSLLKQLVLGSEWRQKRMKAIRFNIIHIPGRVFKRGKKFIVTIAENHPSFGLLVRAHQRLMELGCFQSG
jgi:hypothetical protein